MALTEENIADKIEVVENGTVQVRTANIVLKRDGEETGPKRSTVNVVVLPAKTTQPKMQKVQAHLRCCSHTRGH
jgi:hypothetical protein